MSRKILIAGLGNYSHPGTRHNAGFMAVGYLSNLLNRSKAFSSGDAPWNFHRQCEGWFYEWQGPTGEWPGQLKVFGFEKALKELESTLNRRQEDLVENEARPRADPSEITSLYFFKPKTYMNFSGNAVKKALSHLGLSPENLIILHDELDLPLGKVKWKQDLEKDNGHNGLKSIKASIGPLVKANSLAPYRLRIGIDRPPKVLISRQSVSKRPVGRGIDIEKWVLGKFNPQASEIIQQKVLPLAAMEVLRKALNIKEMERFNFEDMQQKFDF